MGNRKFIVVREKISHQVIEKKNCSHLTNNLQLEVDDLIEKYPEDKYMVYIMDSD
jgi:hypothetical protein